MMKTVLLGALLLTAATVHAQESRQDISLSAFALVPPQVNGNNTVHLFPTDTGGALISYRYLVTPRSGLEVNYSFAQNTNRYQSFGSGSSGIVNVKTRQQEGTVAYVYSRTYRRYNPFVEGGVGGIFYTPILEGTTTLGTKQSVGIAALFGAGVAYEISPSFDLRIQYRGLFSKAPSFGATGGNSTVTNRYEVVSEPAIGIAYHF